MDDRDIDEKIIKFFMDSIANMSTTTYSTTSATSSDVSSLDYESLVKSYKLIKEKNKEPVLKCIVVTGLVSNNDFNKYDIGNNEFVFLVSHAVWVNTLDFCQKKDAQDYSIGIMGYFNSIPVHENDRMAFEIMTKGVFETDFFQNFIIEPPPYIEVKNVEDELSRTYRNTYYNKFY